MNEQPYLQPLDGGHYRNLAGKLRLVAREFRFPNARQELLDLAARYERRADHFDGHSLKKEPRRQAPGLQLQYEYPKENWGGGPANQRKIQIDSQGDRLPRKAPPRDGAPRGGWPEISRRVFVQQSATPPRLSSLGNTRCSQPGWRAQSSREG
jgi:hypothetical protein